MNVLISCPFPSSRIKLLLRGRALHLHRPSPWTSVVQCRDVLLYGVDVVQRSAAFDPPLHRFLVLLAKLLAGRPLTVVAVGGSISAAGHLPGGVMHGTGTYGQALVDWLQQVFPTPPSAPPHRLIRAFLPGAGSYVLHFCTGELLGALWADGEEQRRAAGEADVVLLECAANDWSVLQPGMVPPAEGTQYAAAEGLLRQFLLLPSHPLVLFLNFGVFHPHDPLLSAFHHSAEALLNHLSAYYSVPAVSPWRAYFPLVATAASPSCPAPPDPSSEPAAKPGVLAPPSSERAGNLTWAHMFVDRVHPSAAGHGMAGSLAAHRLFSLALHYLRREGLTLSHHHLRLDWVDSKAAPSTQSALLCPPNSLCRKCFGELGFSALGPPLSAPCMLPPLQSAADPHPRCVLGNTWNVTAVGNVEFPEGYTAVKEAASKGDAASVKRIAEANASWVQEACGPLVPQILCWKAQAARSPLRVAVDVRGATRGIGVVYKMLDWTKQEHKMDGADVQAPPQREDVPFSLLFSLGVPPFHKLLNRSEVELIQNGCGSVTAAGEVCGSTFHDTRLPGVGDAAVVLADFKMDRCAQGEANLGETAVVLADLKVEGRAQGALNLGEEAVEAALPPDCKLEWRAEGDGGAVVGQVRAAMVFLGQVRAAMVFLGQVRAAVVFLGQVRAAMVFLGQVRAAMVFLGQVRAAMVFLGQVRAAMVFLGHVRAATGAIPKALESRAAQSGAEDSPRAVRMQHCLHRFPRHLPLLCCFLRLLCLSGLHCCLLHLLLLTCFPCTLTQFFLCFLHSSLLAFNR
ncbi:unnamed protein product [Closterium sp. Yama58-4]|nr:unnamed protein product [Closterium sp. Yama58-4]